ncbi:MAG: glycosyltransferase [Nocardioidaceae bacterium]|nr:glycosyltransferase [Nocardioidaceae bacterium]
MAVLTSVVVPSRGGAARLPRLLDALVAQRDAAVEAVVVVDGDVDGSAATVAPWRDRLDLTVVVLPENRGRPAALNAGFAAARGDVLVRCDDDLDPAPDFALRHATGHAGPPVGVVGLVRNVFPATPYARAYGRHWDALQREHAYAASPATRWRHWAANASVTRETWQRIGPYDEGFRRYGWEDVDWGYRLHQAGIPVVIDPALETPHHLAAVTCEERARRAFHSGAARLRFERKHDLPTSTAPDSAWGRAVERAAAYLTEERAAAWGRRLDRRVGRVPAPLARKIVAFLVESASAAGHRRPEGVGTTF